MFFRLALALVCFSSVATAQPRLVFLGSASVDGGGGLSGLELGSDGKSGVTVSDRGELFTINLTRIDGQLQNAKLTPWPVLSNMKGDIEGIATNDGSTYFFALEKPAGVVSIDMNRALKALKPHPDFSKMKYNRELEGIAIDRNDVIYTLPEAAAVGTKTYPLYAYKNSKWDVVAQLPKRGFFLTVGADFGPDNLLYLLERSVSPLGFRTQVRRFDLGAKDLAEETLLTTGQLAHDNLEGISLWQDASGATRVTMISDDNFLAFLRSEVVEYILQE